jgi:O-antigen ligase
VTARPLTRAVKRGDVPAAVARHDATEERQELTPELVILAILLLLTAAFGRAFSTVELGVHWLHPTEVMLAAAILAIAVRTRPSALRERLADPAMLIPLAVFWVFGAIAAMRGLGDWGFSEVLHEIGLVEYSLLVPVIALAVTSTWQLTWLARVIAVGGLLAIAVQVGAWWGPSNWALGSELELVSVATGMYVGIYASWVIARLASGASVSRWHYAAVVFGVALVILGGARAVWLAVLVAAALSVALGVPNRRRLAAGIVTGLLAIGTAVSLPLEKLSLDYSAPVDLPAFLTGDIESEPSFTGFAGEIGASFETSSQSANAEWRLAFWEHLLSDSVSNPVLGAGFGAPSSFAWGGNLYDSRTGDPRDPFNVTAPHNSFVNVIYRAGWPAFLALAVLMAIAAVRLLRLTRTLEGEARATALWILTALVVTTIVAGLSAALEGPYMGIFFWVLLGLAWVSARVALPGEKSASATATSGRDR